MSLQGAGKSFVMNYLAHIFLSGSNRKVQLGNFVGDAVKGSSYKNYPPDIAKGIQLHRAIMTIPTIIRLSARWCIGFNLNSDAIRGYCWIFISIICWLPVSSRSPEFP